MTEPKTESDKKSKEMYIQLSGYDVVNYVLVKHVTPMKAAIGVAIMGIAFLFLAVYENILHCPNPASPELKLGYLHNLSWSASMVIVFPAMTGLIIYYYQSVPHFIDQLFHSGEQQDIEDSFKAAVAKKFNLRSYVFFILTIGLAIQWLYFSELRDSNTWIWVGCDASELKAGLNLDKRTWLSWCAAVLQLIFTFVFLLFLFRAIAFSFELKKLLEREDYDNVPVPFHPDGTSGYGFIRERIFLTMLILTLLGGYVALYVIDKFHQEPNLSLGVPFLFVTFYILLGGTIVATSFYAAHIQMQKAKQKLLDPIGRSIKVHLTKIGTTDLSQLDKRELEVVGQLKTLYKELNQQIPEWPLNVRSTADVVQGLIVPSIPAFMAFLGKWF